MSRLLLGLLFLVILNSSCSKNEQLGHSPCTGNEKDIYLTEAIKELRFLSSTHWVYVDSLNSRIDSVWVESHNQGIGEWVCKNKMEFHNFKTKTSSSSRLSYFTILGGGLFADAEKGYDALIYSDFDSTTPSALRGVAKFDSIFIYDRFYKKVLSTEIEKTNAGVKIKRVFFVNAEFGILKETVYQDSVLLSNKLLIRSHFLK